MKKVMITGGQNQSWIQNCRSMLSERYELVDNRYRGSFWSWFKTVLIKGWNADFFLCIFANDRTAINIVISKLYRKKLVAIVGGHAVENMPEINYGSTTKFKQWRVRWILKHADVVLPFSDYGKKNALNFYNKDRYTVVPLSIDTNKYKPKGNKKDVVVTVGMLRKSNIKRKGFDTFINVAKLLPDVEFYLVGKTIDDTIDYVNDKKTSNLHVFSDISDGQLLQLYQRAKVYCALSYQEGDISGAIGEAISCGCVPVISKKAEALVDGCKGMGYYVPYGNAEETAEAVKTALKDKNNDDYHAFIKNNNSMEVVKEKLFNVLEE